MWVCIYFAHRFVILACTKNSYGCLVYLFSSGLDLLSKDSHALEKMAEAFPDMFSEIIQDTVVYQRLKIIGMYNDWHCSCNI